MITEEMLKAAAAEADQAIRDALPAPEDCGHTFSRQFEKKMRRISRRARHPVLYRLARSAACFALVAALIGGTWLTVDAVARAAFLGWIKQLYNTYVVYHFWSADSGEQASQAQEPDSTGYALAWIPDGYTLWQRVNVGDSTIVIYSDESGKLLSFGYARGSGPTYWFVETSTSTQEPASVEGVPADFYRSRSPEIANELVWMSPDGETAFYLDGFFSKDELIEMAEHVFPYDSERIKHYAPTWLPEGFEVSEPIQLDTMYGLTYTNSDGQKITFTCIYGGDATDVIIASENMTASAVTVGTVQADFYEEPQAGNANMLVWQPETDECLFCIAAPLPEETLVRIAESVVEEQEG